MELRDVGLAEDACLVTDMREEAVIARGEIATEPGLLTDQTAITRTSGDESTAATAIGDWVTPAPVRGVLVARRPERGEEGGRPNMAGRLATGAPSHVSRRPRGAARRGLRRALDDNDALVVTGPTRHNRNHYRATLVTAHAGPGKSLGATSVRQIRPGCR